MAVDSLVVVVVVSLAGLDDLDDVGCTLTHEKRGHVLRDDDLLFGAGFNGRLSPRIGRRG